MSNRTITVFTDGDSSLLSTWSNVPYLMTKSFEKDWKAKVNRINMAPDPRLEYLFNTTVGRVVRVAFDHDTSYDFKRSFLHKAICKHRMKQAVKRYPDTDLFLSLSYSWNPKKYTEKPCMMFCDWSYGYYFEKFKQRKPDWFEQRELKREEEYLAQCDYVISLFPDSAKWLQMHGVESTAYLGNVINAVEDADERSIPLKRKSKSIVFIGREQYIGSACELVKAVETLNGTGDSWNVQIIGVEQRELCKALGREEIPDFAQCYGYLSKDKEEGRKVYYNTLRDAFACVNTTPQWAAMSSVIEEMYFYNPIITMPNDNFVQMFGQEITFGKYVCSNTAQEIMNAIKELESLDEAKYKEMCYDAHKAVESYTWKNYTSEMLQIAGK